MDIFVFQMGKVGSSAITRAFCERGLNAVQTHWLGREQWLAALEQHLLDDEQNEAVAQRGLDGFIQNIANTRRLLWYQRHHRHEGEKLRVVTLARDPLDWYWGHLAENFDLYGPAILDWYSQVYDTNAGPNAIEPATEAFHRSLFECFGRIRRRVEHPRFDRAAIRQKVNGIHALFLCQQLMKLRLPAVWFDVFFKPPLGIDIYRSRIDPVRGTARYENAFCQVLLIRYENLAIALDELAGFVGLDQVEFEPTNRSLDKPLPFDLRALRQRIICDPGMLRRLYRTRYCRHFGYPLAD